MHLSFQTALLLVTSLLVVAGVCKAIAISLGYDDSSGLQQDALPLAFGIHLTHFAFQVTSNCWLLFIWKMLIVHPFCSAVFR